MDRTYPGGVNVAAPAPVAPEPRATDASTEPAPSPTTAIRVAFRMECIVIFPLRRDGQGVHENPVVVRVSDVELTVGTEGDVLRIEQLRGAATRHVAGSDDSSLAAIRFVDDHDTVVVTVSDREEARTVRCDAVGKVEPVGARRDRRHDIAVAHRELYDALVHAVGDEQVAGHRIDADARGCRELTIAGALGAVDA